ncbi:MAG: triacylglycerol lipase [Actinomycetota bacterium]|jgi:pimeloyl-ACP methyl ester carboxylesterase
MNRAFVRILGMLITLVLLAGGVAVARAETPAPEPAPPLTVEPKDDPFYAAPEDLASAAPGAVLRVRALSLTAYGFPIPVGGWQLLVRSTDSAGAPVAVVTSIILPSVAYAGGGARPLLSYQMAIDALGDHCQPSYTLRTGTQKEAPTLLPGLQAGWAVVTTDFEGPRHAYGAGPMAGHAVLDGIRAATHFAPAGLSGDDTPVGLMGYSGGGQATTWAAELQPAYAPELNVVGIAGGGVPVDLNQVARHLDGRLEAGIGIAAGVGINREFPAMGLDALFNERGRQVAAEVSDGCIDDYAVQYPNVRFADLTDAADPLSLPQVVSTLEANSLAKAAPTAPFYLYHSVVDQLVPVAGADKLAQYYCAEGDAPVFYDRNAAGEHIGYAFTGGVTAFAFLAERFAGLPAPDNCAAVPVIAGGVAPAPAAPAASASAAADHPGRAYGTEPPPGANNWGCVPSAAHPNPVVLVHGMGARASWNWGTFSPKLAAEGYCVFALTYGRRTDVPPPFDTNGGMLPMEQSAEQLAQFVDAVREATGAAKVDIVGHSEGSLMPNYYVKFGGGAAFVDRYIGMTPLWDGTNLLEAGTFTELGRPYGATDAFNEAFFGWNCEACPQVIKGSDFLRRMREGPTGPRVPGVTYTMIMTAHDELVVPYTSGVMDGATNIVIQDQCVNDTSEHVALAVDPVVLRNILNALDPAHAQPINCGIGLTFFQ